MMELVNRVRSVDILLVNIIRDYFKHEIEKQYGNDSWKEKFGKIVHEKMKEDKARSSYKATFDKIQMDGIDAYSFDDMDATILCAIMEDGRLLKRKMPPKAYKFIPIIREDRNGDSHPTGTADDFEYVSWAFATLRDLLNFVLFVKPYSPTEKESNWYQEYAMKYRGEIQLCSRLIHEDYKDSLKYERITEELKELKATGDTLDGFHRLWEKYFKTHDKGLYTQFILRAAELGFQSAGITLADMSFEEYGLIKDYTLSAYYYEKYKDKLMDLQLMRLASLYINGYSERHSKEDGFNILDSIKSDIDEIKSVTQDDGFEYYYLYHEETDEEKTQRHRRELKMQGFYK